MPARLNCWEATSCGREPGGANVSEFGLCPATTDTSVDGINGGKNGGRICWTVVGTFCGGEVQSLASKKKLTCLSCEFFSRTIEEEGPNVTLVRPGQTTWLGYYTPAKALPRE
ncbi:MAG: two-CW domain-containing protein [Planctomycetota bacterium]